LVEIQPKRKIHSFESEATTTLIMIINDLIQLLHCNQLKSQIKNEFCFLSQLLQLFQLLIIGHQRRIQLNLGLI